MKKVVWIVLALASLGLAYLAVAGSKIQEISTEIDIDAPPSKVWEVLADINSWQAWSPIIKKSQGTTAIGSELSVTMIGKQKNQDGPTYSPIITDLKEPYYLRWRAHMLAGFVFTNYKILELEAPSTGTRLTHKELFKGLLAPIFCGQMETGVPPMLRSMNQALKEQVEK